MSQSQYPSSFDHEGLLASGRGELFGPGNAQLPAPPMLMFDRIKTISADGGDYGKGYVEAELDINPDLWFFQCHFIGDPVMPGCLGLDAMWQLVGFYLGWIGGPGKGRALAAEFLAKGVVESRLALGQGGGGTARKGETAQNSAPCRHQPRSLSAAASCCGGFAPRGK